MPWARASALDRHLIDGHAWELAGCLWWMGPSDSAGYGTSHLDGKRIRAHRLSYLVFVGPIPDGLLVLHTCDHKLCVLPEHLMLGTHHDNLVQAWDRLRTRKVTPALRARIHSSTLSAPKLSKVLGISETAIKQVRRAMGQS